MGNTTRVIGLISGSSLDGLDVGVCTFLGNAPESITWECEHAFTQEFPENLQNDLRKAPTLSGKELCQLEHGFSLFCAGVVQEYLEESKVEVDAIASHGHTVFHFPEKGWTTQIGKGATIAELTGIATITDVRANDVALGGQGAPVAPIVEKWLLPGYEYYINFGGITNISRHGEEGVISFDSGACNQVLNTIISERGLPYDDKGKVASQGKINQELLDAWLALPYHELPSPKSLDNGWVRDSFIPVMSGFDLSIEDRLATATEYIAIQCAKDMKKLKTSSQLEKVLITGGGAHNDFLLERLAEYLSPVNIKIEKPDKQLIEFKEAILIALMGYLRLLEIPNTLSTVTGAKKNSISGAITIPS